MKVVFLDVDGVLNCKRTPNPRKFPFIVAPALLTRLNRLLDLAGAKVVLASNWRYDPAGMFSARHNGVPVHRYDTGSAKPTEVQSASRLAAATIGNARRINATSSRPIRSRCR